MELMGAMGGFRETVFVTRGAVPGSPVVLLDFIGAGLHSFCPDLSGVYSSLNYDGRRVRDGLSTVSYGCGTRLGGFI